MKMLKGCKFSCDLSTNNLDINIEIITEEFKITISKYIDIITDKYNH